MPVYAALLRGVNVGGRNKIKMADLRALCEPLGLTKPRTLLQSGNLVFATRKRNPTAIARSLEQAIEGHAGFHCRVILRTAAELRRALEANPFANETGLNRSHVLFHFLAGPLSDSAPGPAVIKHAGPEAVIVDGDVAYVHYVEGIANSKLDLSRLERLLALSGTARNWNTVEKLVALAGEPGG